MAFFLFGSWTLINRQLAGKAGSPVARRGAPSSAPIAKEAGLLPEKAAPEPPPDKSMAAREPGKAHPPPIMSAAPSVRPSAPSAAKEPPAMAHPRKAVADPIEKMLASLAPTPTFPPPGAHGVVAIIIDDIGQSMEPVERLLAMGEPIALSVLPGLPHSHQAAELAKERGQVVMLHLPMEPKGRENHPGPGALLASHDRAGLLRQFTEDMESVPGAVGVNNHMGSLLTERVESMEPLMEEFAGRGLFFVDSVTSPATVAYGAARRAGLPSAKRDVFLDNERDVGKITEALDLLVSKALKNGSAVAIGHPYPETIRALERYLPRFAAKGVKLMPITRLLSVSGETGFHARRPASTASCSGKAC